MAIVTAPVADFNGESVCGVVFTDGVAETDDPSALRYFESAGYDVADGEPKVDEAAVLEWLAAEEQWKAEQEAAKAAAAKLAADPKAPAKTAAAKA